MSPLLALPREIRDAIWSLVCQSDSVWSSYGFVGPRRTTPTEKTPRGSSSLHERLCICRQICQELTPYLYQTVCVNLAHSNQALRWISTIGPRNSSSIRHLVLRFPSLLIDYNEDRYINDRKLAWAAALHCLPNLSSLTFEFEENEQVGPIRATYDRDILASDPVVGNELAVSAAAWAKVLQPSVDAKSASWEYTPELKEKPITHAVLSIDENMPFLLVQYFSKIIGFSESPSLDLHITGLPPYVFTKNGFVLARTYAFNENSENPTATLSYFKLPQKPSSPALSVHVMLSQLPQLLYLRVGCRNIDSTFLTHLPDSIQTLDVAFTDTNPVQVATALQIMRARCEKLFTLAIAVSPLHDRELSDNREEKFFNRRSMSEDIVREWDPFWTALDYIQSTGVRVWEGEGPGFKRNTVARFS